MIPSPQVVFLRHQVGAIGWHLKALVGYHMQFGISCHWTMAVVSSPNVSSVDS